MNSFYKRHFELVGWSCKFNLLQKEIYLNQRTEKKGAEQLELLIATLANPCHRHFIHLGDGKDINACESKSPGAQEGVPCHLTSSKQGNSVRTG